MDPVFTDVSDVRLSKCNIDLVTPDNNHASLLNLVYCLCYVSYLCTFLISVRSYFALELACGDCVMVFQNLQSNDWSCVYEQSSADPVGLSRY